MKEPKRTVLWSAAGQQANNTSIELTDSIDNYDELWFYGSGTRTYTPCVITEYPVIPGVVNLGGPFFAGQWGSTDNWLLCNGTQVFLSGNSGYVASSFYFGKNNGSTAWAASIVNNRTNDVRPFKIVGLKYQSDPNRATLWESTGVNLYNQDISLNEPLTHFNRFEVYSSGYETGSVGCRHAGKNIYQTQPRIMNCGSWAYTPWKYAERHNLLIGDEMLISGNSGHIRSGYYWGMGNQTTAYAAGRWNSDYALSALQPYKIVGVDHKPVLNLNLINGEHGTISADTSTGCEYDYVNLEATPNEGWYFSGYSISGAQLTGNQFRFNNSDVTVEGGWTDQGYPITYLSDAHVHLTGDSIYIPGSEGITLDSGYDTYYRISGYDITGGSIVNGKLVPTGPCTIKAVQKVNSFTARGKFNQVTRASENWGRNGTGQAYAYAYYTGGTNCPNSYYTATYTSNNRGTTNAKASGWNPTGNISGYSFTGASTSYAFVEATNRFGGGMAILQVNNSNFGAGAWPNVKGNPTCTATGSTTTKGPVRYYLSGKCAQGYQLILSCLTTTGNNGWTATGIAP